MISKSLLRTVDVRDSAGKIISGNVYRKLVDASDDDGKDYLAVDTLELSDGRLAYLESGRWVDEDDHTSFFDELR